MAACLNAPSRCNLTEISENDSKSDSQSPSDSVASCDKIYEANRSTSAVSGMPQEDGLLVDDSLHKALPPENDPGTINAEVDLEKNASQKSGKPNKKNLRVTFPEGNGVVSGYMDPPIPWDDVSSCTTEVLVSSYLKSCEKFGVKPIQKLLNQLQAIANFHERNETLTLRNDHLDHRHCETLEEVLRRVQFRTIDLEATKMDDEAAVVIFDMIEYYESCIRLNISSNKSFGPRGWQACARLIRKASCLQQLDAQGCNIADQLMPFMARALRVGTSLVSLHLENTMMSGKSLSTLVLTLKTNETLRELYLADNKLMPSDAIQLSSLLKHNKSLRLLDLRNNHIQDVGMGHLCEGIFEQGSSDQGLETLVVWGNQLSYQSMNSLSRALMETKTLADLNLGHNNITNEGIHRLKDGLLKNNSLLRIGFQAIKISCEGAVAIAEYLAETTKLMRVDLKENFIKTGGLMALSLALKVNKSVVRVDLDKELKKESGVKDYASQQKHLLVDIFLYVDRNCKLALQREEDRKKAMMLEGENKKDVVEEKNVQSLVGVSSPVSPGSEEEERGRVGSREQIPSEKLQSIPFSCTSSLPSAFNSNNSSRSRLHLDLQSSVNDLLPSDSPGGGDFVSPASAGPRVESSDSTPPTKKKTFVVPPSPVVVSHGSASLIPIMSDGMFSPVGDSGDRCLIKEEFECIDCEPWRTEGSFENLQISSKDFVSAQVPQKDGKAGRKVGKMPREKRMKFVVTKISGHYHATGHGNKKLAGKCTGARRSSAANAVADVISAIDKAASAISSPTSPESGNPKSDASATVRDSHLHSKDCSSSTAESFHCAQSLEGHSPDLPREFGGPHAEAPQAQIPDVVQISEVQEVTSAHSELNESADEMRDSPAEVDQEDEKLTSSPMNGLLRVDTPDIS